jgi:hypothetical protein
MHHAMPPLFMLQGMYIEYQNLTVVGPCSSFVTIFALVSYGPAVMKPAARWSMCELVPSRPDLQFTAKADSDTVSVWPSTFAGAAQVPYVCM